MDDCIRIKRSVGSETRYGELEEKGIDQMGEKLVKKLWDWKVGEEERT